jgi:hypothetical protein
MDDRISCKYRRSHEHRIPYHGMIERVPTTTTTSKMSHVELGAHRLSLIASEGTQNAILSHHSVQDARGTVCVLPAPLDEPQTFVLFAFFYGTQPPRKNQPRWQRRLRRQPRRQPVLLRQMIQNLNQVMGSCCLQTAALQRLPRTCLSYSSTANSRSVGFNGSACRVRQRSKNRALRTRTCSRGASLRVDERVS